MEGSLRLKRGNKSKRRRIQSNNILKQGQEMRSTLDDGNSDTSCKLTTKVEAMEREPTFGPQWEFESVERKMRSARKGESLPPTKKTNITYRL